LDAIWVFQIGSSFTTSPSRKVILVGMARADNVFWNVGSSTTIGLGCTVVGNFLTQVSITANSGTTLEGRFLTQTGAVTLDPSTTINRPKPVH
jgi:type VI secretion system secreted protein VgrG